MSVFLCERWRSVDLDLSLSIRSSLCLESAKAGLAPPSVWIGTDIDATAGGMTDGVAAANLFVLILRDGTLKGRGVQHEVAAALRRKKCALVLYDEGSVRLDDMLKQALSPDGSPVPGYDALSIADCAKLESWAYSTPAPLGFRCDGSFETTALPRIASLILSLTPSCAEVPA
jgi:hypothetical protein